MTKNKRVEIRHHIIFWVVYLMLWSARDMVFYPHFLDNFSINFIFTIPTLPFVYINIFYFLPRFLLKNKWGVYIILFTISLVIVTWLRFELTHFIFRDILGSMSAAQQFSGWNGLVIIGSESLILATVTMALFMVSEWFIKERYTRELEQKNLESELNMLKAQLQPHFLFNNLNTIYFLMESNPTLAKEVMIQFSDLLSHQLYNAKKDKVPLHQELESLDNYIKIQKVRHQDFLQLNYSFPKDSQQLQIAPMILLTFIENAFKHGQNEEGYKIDITIEVTDNDLHLLVVNTNGHQQKEEKGGVGLANVKRRLELLYPDRHRLVVEETTDVYKVDLTMTLEAHG